MTGLVLRDMPEGRLQWELRAAEVRDGSSVSRLKEVRMTWREPGRPVVQVKAPEALWDAGRGLMDMRGPLWLVAPAVEAELEGQALTWRREGRTLALSGGVRLRRGRGVLRARAMEADEGLRRIRLQGPITMRVPVSHQPAVQLKGRT